MRRNPRLAVTRLEDRLAPVSRFWTGGPPQGIGTDWFNPVHWRTSEGTPGVPGPGDDASLNSTAVGEQPTIVVNGNATVGTLDNQRVIHLDAGVFALGPGDSNLGTFVINGTSLDVASGATLSTLLGGSLSGTGTFTNFAGRTIGLQTFGTSVAFTNEGTTVVTAAASLSGPITSAAGSVFRVVALNSFFGHAMLRGFVNNGDIELTSVGGVGSSASATIINSDFTNAAGGRILVLAGAGGSRNFDPGSQTFFNAGTIHVDAGTTLTLSSNITWQGGTITGGGTITMPTTTIAAGAVLDAPAGVTLTFRSGAGAITGPGTFRVLPGRTQSLLNGSGIDTPFDLQGTAVVNAVTFNGPLTTTAGSVLRAVGFMNAPAFTNNGLFEVANPAHVTVNGGPLTNAAGGTIRVLPGGSVSNLPSGLVNQGAIVVDGQAFIGSGLTNAGTLTVNAGGQLEHFAPFTNPAGGIVAGNGLLRLSNGGTNNGTLSPGLGGPGTLTVGGTGIAQSATGRLAVDLFGPAVSTEYDQLRVDGSVTLAGELTINPASTPSVGTMFTLIDNDGTDAVSGTFTNLPQMGTITVAGSTYRIAYNGGSGNDVTLTVLSTPGPAPRVSGLQVNAGQSNMTQRSRVTSLTVTFSTQVTFAGAVADAFALSRITGGAVGGFTATASVVNGMTVVTLNAFTGAETNFGSLADGRFALVVRANQVSAGGLQLDGDGNGTGGDDYSLNGTVANGLYRLYGDVDADGFVNAADFGQFRPTFGTSTGQTGYLDYLDFDGDGSINAFDFGQLRNRFGSGVP